MPVPRGVTKAVARNPNFEVEPPGVSVRAADVVFLATPFRANETVLAGVADDLQGKILRRVDIFASGAIVLLATVALVAC
jgi:predicted dinucleotide-binding enzyme